MVVTIFIDVRLSHHININVIIIKTFNIITTDYWDRESLMSGRTHFNVFLWNTWSLFLSWRFILRDGQLTCVLACFRVHCVHQDSQSDILDYSVHLTASRFLVFNLLTQFESINNFKTILCGCSCIYMIKFFQSLIRIVETKLCFLMNCMRCIFFSCSIKMVLFRTWAIIL